ncbi:MAG: hypothetical protein SGILL_004735, partial [Bacillariaceae sp.]
MEEATCQALLPFVVAACRNHKSRKAQVWQNWGLIMASTMVETGVLATEPRNLVVMSIFEGLARQKKIAEKSNQTTANHFGPLLSNGMTVALSLLMQESSPVEDADSDDENVMDCRLPILSSSSSGGSEMSLGSVGFAMAKQTFSVLLRLDDDGKADGVEGSLVADCIGQLYDVEGIVEFKHWIASILAAGWKLIAQTGTKEQKERHSRRVLHLLLSLIKQPNLKESLWKDNYGSWIESYASFVLSNTPLGLIAGQDDESATQAFALVSAKTILAALRDLQKLPYERGVAHALTQIKKKTDRKKCADWLGLAKLRRNQSAEGLEAEAEILPSDTIALPPRVALEHFDCEMRLNAISTLLDEYKSEDAMDIDEDGESTPQALLRRFVMDDDDKVALAAAKAVHDMLQSGAHFESKELGESALEAVHKWSSLRSLDAKKQADLLVHSCHFASNACQQLFHSGEKNVLWVRLVEALGVMLAHDEDSVSKAAEISIASAFQDGSKKKIKSSRKKALALLTSDHALLRGFRRQFATGNTSELAGRRQLVGVIFESLATSLDATFDHFSDVIEYCVWVMHTFADDLSDSSTKNFSKFLLASTDKIASEPESIHSIAGRLAGGDASAFEIAVAPFIKAVCSSVADRSDDKVTPLSVLMEMTLATNDKKSIENLVSVGLELAKKSPTACLHAMVPAMALCSHSDESVRELAVTFVSALSSELSKSKNTDESAMSAFGRFFNENKSSMVLEGESFLPRALSSVLSGFDDADSARDYILNSLCAAVFTSGANDFTTSHTPYEKGWLGVGKVVGGYRAALCMLQAMESAGEVAFPLHARYSVLGKPILEAFLHLKNADEMHEGFLDLVLLSVRMLKGMKVPNSGAGGDSTRTTIISSGPTIQGGRSRSYSFGSNDVVSFLRPYPKEMSEMIVRILESAADGKVHEDAGKALFEDVLSRKSWQQEVFAHIDSKDQQRLASGILAVASESWIQTAEATLFSMPLQARDVVGLLRGGDSTEDGVASMSLVFDYASTNAERLSADKHVDELLSALFGQLLVLTKTTSEDDAFKFARQSLLKSLAELSQFCLKLGSLPSKLGKNKKFVSWVDCLVDILCGNDGTTQPDVSRRSQMLIFSILATLCDQFPATVVPKYLRVIAAYASMQNVASEPKMLTTCFESVLSAFLQHSAAAGLSQVDLFRDFIDASSVQDSASKLRLYGSFARALSTVSSVDTPLTVSPAGSFVVAALAKEAYDPNADDNQPQTVAPQLATQILSGLDSPAKVDAIVTMQGYSKQMLFKVLGRDEEEDDDSTKTLSFEKLCENILPDTDAESTVTYKKLCSLLTVAICDLTATLDLRVRSERSNDVSTKKLLSIWQDFLLMQSLCHSNSNESDLRGMAEVIGQAMDWVQSCLPPHVYVAFATNLMKEGSTEELRSRAVQLIAERCSSLTPAKPESGLFVEMVPTLTDLLNGNGSEPTSMSLEHSIFAAIDVIGRNCYATEPEKSKKISNGANVFVSVLDKAADAISIKGNPEGTQSFTDLSMQSRQVVSSAAICASTAVKISGPKSVPALSKLISSLLNMLSTTSQFLNASSPSNDEKLAQERNQARLVQLSMLRALKSVVENLPLHLKPFLGPILTSLSEIPSTFERDENKQAQLVESEFTDVATTTSSRIPSRQIVPAVATAMSSTGSPSAAVSLLKTATSSVTSANSSEVSNQTKLVLQIAFQGFEGTGMEQNEEMTKASSELILALVMKQSEVQLRSLYKKLRIWRDDPDTETTKQRRLAFWSLSAELSKNLKAIYLPCLSMSFTDAVEELENASSKLTTTKHSKKSSDGRKKQKLDLDDTFDETQLATLQSLLACLEVSLRWDAHSGGAWIREMDSQRFN